MPPKKELRFPEQITSWLSDWGTRLNEPGSMILIGSGGLLWHAAQRGISIPLPENSMDVNPITHDDHVAELAYDSLIGSEFELRHGWHVKLMPAAVLSEFPADWETRSSSPTYGKLTVVVPSATDLLIPKLKRNEPRDQSHALWARQLGLTNS